MSRERALIELELTPATVRGESNWVHARWQRADASGGVVFVRARRKTQNEWYIAELSVDQPSGELLRDVPLARIAAAINADERIRAWVAEGVRRQQPPRRKLKRPGGRRLDDQFYREVAAAYVSAVAHGLRPAKTLADDSDTPQGTVNRWIATARDRGFLPPPGR